MLLIILELKQITMETMFKYVTMKIYRESEIIVQFVNKTWSIIILIISITSSGS